MWVSDENDHKIYAYNMSTKARDSSQDFDTLSAAGNNGPGGIWSNGTTMWVSDTEVAVTKIYAYDMTTKARDSSKDFDTLSAAGNNGPGGIWSNGTTMWVSDSGDDKIYAYESVNRLPDTYEGNNIDEVTIDNIGQIQFTFENEFNDTDYGVFTENKVLEKETDTHRHGNFSIQNRDCVWSIAMTKIFVKTGDVRRNISELVQPLGGIKYFRAWQVPEDGSEVTVDMDMAKNILREDIREERTLLWPKIDADWFKAVEAGDEKKQKEVSKMKQKYRDAPNHDLIASAKTIDDLLKLNMLKLVNTDSASDKE